MSDSPTNSARAGRSSGRRCAARACRTGVMTYPSRLASHALGLPDALPPREGGAPHGLCAANEVNAGPRVLMLEAERNRHRPDTVRADTPHAPPILFSVMDALFFAGHCSRSCHRRIGGDGHSVADQRKFFGHIIAQVYHWYGSLAVFTAFPSQKPSIPPPPPSPRAFPRPRGLRLSLFLRRRSALPSTGPMRAMCARTSGAFLMGQPLAALPQERR